MNLIVFGDDAVLFKVLQTRFDYAAEELSIGIAINGVIVVRGVESEMMQCIVGQYSDFPQTLVWQSPAMHASTLSFLLSWAEIFSRQDRHLVIHLPESVPLTQAISSRFKIIRKAGKSGYKRYRNCDSWTSNMDRYVESFFHLSKIQ